MVETATLTEEQKIALKRLGKEDTTTQKTPEQIEEEKRIAAEEENRKKEEEEKKKKQSSSKPQDDKIEITDDVLIAELKKKGINVSSLEDLVPKATAEDEQKKKEKRESDKVVWGLQNGKFSKDQLANFNADSKDKKALVIKTVSANIKELNPDLSENEIEATVKERFGLDKDETSWQYKQGLREIELLGDKILTDNYAPIISLENDYSTFENQIISQKQKEQKILTEAPLYKKAVTEAISSIDKIEVSFSDDEKYYVPIPQDIKDDIQNKYLADEIAQIKIESGYSVDQIKAEASQAIINKNLSIVAFEIAKQYRQKHEKGLRGIPEGSNIRKTEEGTEHLTDQQKQALQFFKIDKAPASAN